MKKRNYLSVLAAMFLIPLGMCSCSDNNEEEVETPILTELDGKYLVEFNLNYKGAANPDTLLVEKNHMMQMSDRRQPEREGYRL